MLLKTKNRNIKTRILILVVTPILLVSIAHSYYQIDARINDAKQDTLKKKELISDYLVIASEYALYTGNVSVLENIINQSLAHANVSKVIVYNNKKQVIASSERKPHEREVVGDFIASLVDIEVVRTVKPVYASGFTVLDYEEESLGLDFNENNNEIIGWVEVSLTQDELIQKKISIVRNSILITLVTLIIGILFSLRTVESFTRPLLRLTNMVSGIQKGRYGNRVKEESTGELGTLEIGFNAMATALESSQKLLQEKVEVATRELTSSVSMLEIKNNELKVAQAKAERASHVKDEFLARMSHEIRTPINAVMGYAKLLEKTKQTEEQTEHTRVINRACHQLLTVIDDVLSYSKLESGSIRIENVDFDIQESLEDVVGMLSQAAHEKRLELVLLLYSDVPVVLSSDPVRINQILINLVNNAIKFTEHGNIVIHVENIQETEGEVTLKISVLDTGIGISEKEIETLFSEFTQADSSITRRYGGTGLGLAIAKKLTEILDGSIHVESQVGEGSKFWFTVKCSKATKAVPKRDAENSLNNRNILLYEENQYSLRSIRNNYITWGAAVFTARTKDRLFAILTKDKSRDINRFDVLVLGMSYSDIEPEVISSMYSMIRAHYEGPIVFLVGAEFYNPPKVVSDDSSVIFQGKPIRRNSLLKTTLTLLGHDIERNVAVPEVPTLDWEGQEAMVLVVEDNVFNQSLITSLLKERHINPIVASDAAEALEIINSTDIDLILMDIHLPDMSGIEAAKIIKANTSTSKTVPIVALTADVFIQDDPEYSRSGIDDCIIKPIAEERFWSVIEKWLHNDNSDNQCSKDVQNNERPSTLVRVDAMALKKEIQDILRRIIANDHAASIDILAREVHDLKGLVDYFSMNSLKGYLVKLEKYLGSNNTSKIQNIAKEMLRDPSLSQETNDR